MLLQSRRRQRCASSLQVSAAGDQHRMGARQRPGDVRLGRGRRVAQGEIEAIACQRSQFVRHLEFETDRGVGLHELRNAMNQLLPCERHRRGDPEPAGRHAGEVANAREARRDLLECALRVFDQPGAGFRQLDAARRPAYKGDAGGTLKICDALAHCRLAHAQSSGGGGVAAMDAEHGQPVQRRP